MAKCCEVLASKPMGERIHRSRSCMRCPWRYLPANFPPWQTVFYHFRRLHIKGTWTLLLRALHRAERERQGRHPDPSAESRDSQSVKTVEESSGICGYDAHKHIWPSETTSTTPSTTYIAV